MGEIWDKILFGVAQGLLAGATQRRAADRPEGCTFAIPGSTDHRNHHARRPTFLRIIAQAGHARFVSTTTPVSRPTDAQPPFVAWDRACSGRSQSRHCVSPSGRFDGLTRPVRSSRRPDTPWWMAAPARCIPSRSTGAAPLARIGGPAAFPPPCLVFPRHSEDGLREAANISRVRPSAWSEKRSPYVCSHSTRRPIRAARSQRRTSPVSGTRTPGSSRFSRKRSV